MFDSTGILVIGLIIAFILWLILKNKGRSRTIPSNIKQAVRERFYGQCAFCIETRGLEFHHRKEFADGGEHTIENITLICPTHHAILQHGK